MVLEPRAAFSCGFDRAAPGLAAGYDRVVYAPNFWNPDGTKTIVHLDFTPAEVDQDYPPAVEVVADVREALDLLRDLVSVRRGPTPPPAPPDRSLAGPLQGPAGKRLSGKTHRLPPHLRKVLR